MSFSSSLALIGKKPVSMIFNEVACSTSSAVFSQSTTRCQRQRLCHEDTEQIIGRTSNQPRVLCTCGNCTEIESTCNSLMLLHSIDTNKVNRLQILVVVTSLVDGDTKVLGVSFPSLLMS